MTDPLLEIRTEHKRAGDPEEVASTTDLIIGGTIVFRSSHIGGRDEADDSQPSHLKQLVLDALRQFGYAASDDPTGPQG